MNSEYESCMYVSFENVEIIIYDVYSIFRLFVGSKDHARMNHSFLSTLSEIFLTVHSIYILCFVRYDTVRGTLSNNRGDQLGLSILENKKTIK